MKKYRELTIQKVKPEQEEILQEILRQIGAIGVFSEMPARLPSAAGGGTESTYVKTSTLRSKATAEDGSADREKTKKGTAPFLIKAYFDLKLLPKILMSLFENKLSLSLIKIDQKHIKIGNYRPKTVKKSSKLIKIGNFLIVSSNNKRHFKKDKIILKIDDFMAFGTGFHETTQMCLRYLKSGVNNSLKVLDIGTGSGILAIAAAKLGAKVLAMEKEPTAFKVAKANVKVNKVSKKVKVIKADIFKFKSKQKYDLILANLTAEIFEKLIPRIRHLLKKSGSIIMSGIQKKYLKGTLALLKKHKINIKKSSKKGDWQAILASY